jgi:hypothetical protein
MDIECIAIAGTIECIAGADFDFAIDAEGLSTWRPSNLDAHLILSGSPKLRDIILGRLTPGSPTPDR